MTGGTRSEAEGVIEGVLDGGTGGGRECVVEGRVE